LTKKNPAMVDSILNVNVYLNINHFTFNSLLVKLKLIQ